MSEKMTDARALAVLRQSSAPEALRDTALDHIASRLAQPKPDDAQFDVVAFIRKKADDYAAENCSVDYDHGALVYRFGNAGMEYHNGLLELADEIAMADRIEVRRAEAASAPVAEPDRLPREEFAASVVRAACETEPADLDDPDTIRISCDDLRCAVLAAFCDLDIAAPPAQQQGAHFNMVIFAIEDAVRNGVCPWGIESAFDAYELERRGCKVECRCHVPSLPVE